MKYSVRSLYAAAGVTTVGDVAYLSNKSATPQALSRLCNQLINEEWFQKAVAPVGLGPITRTNLTSFIALESLYLAMKRTMKGFPTPEEPFRMLDRKREPAWMTKLPPSAQRYIRCSYATTEGTDPLGIVPKFPYMGFGYVIADSGIASEATQVFNLHRLHSIKQLSFLHDPVGTENDLKINGLLFDHSRYCHVLDTYTVANLIDANLGINGSVGNTLGTTAISHDALTPAGGDSVKLIDPQAFDEDAHYPELLDGPAWNKYREQFGIDRELLIQTILGKGFLGRILDIADKSSYLARDVNAYLGTATPQRDARNVHYYTIADMVINDPYICAVWESARRYDGTLVFGNAERLGRFLKLRALMFRALYYNPYSRFFEYLIGKGVVKYLYMNGQVTREDLLKHEDYWLERKIDEVLGAFMMLRACTSLESARVEEHRDMDAAKRRAAEFESNPSVIVILDDFFPTTSDGTRKFMVRNGRRVEVFADAFPKQAEEIAGIMTFPKVTRLHFLDADDLQLSHESRARLKAILKIVS